MLAQCGSCGKRAPDIKEALHRCLRYGLAAYCNSECQRAHWRAKQKEQCRSGGQLAEGDIVQMTGEELDGLWRGHRGQFFVVNNEDGEQDGCWLIENAQLLSQPHSAKGVNLQRVLVD